MIIIEGIPQAVMHQTINQLAIAKLCTGAAISQNVWCAAHVFLATGDDNIRLATLDRLSSQMQCFKPGTANVINSDCRNAVRKTTFNSRLPCRILPCPCSQHLTKNYFIHRICRNAGTFY